MPHPRVPGTVALSLEPLSTNDALEYWRVFLEGRADVPTRDLTIHVERYLHLPPEEQRTHLALRRDGRMVGTLRLLPATITGFSLLPEVADLATGVIVRAVDLLRSRGAQAITASFEDRYEPSFRAVGFRRRFARMRMETATRRFPPREGLVLKPPEEAEVAGLARFLREVYEGHMEQALGLHAGSDEEWQGYVAGVLKGEVGRFMPEASFLVLEGDRIAAVVLLSHWMGSPMVAELGVAQERRGRGLGRGLLEAASTRLEALGESRWALYVTVGNGPAVHLYESLGFARVGGETVTAVLGASEPGRSRD